MDSFSAAAGRLGAWSGHPQLDRGKGAQHRLDPPVPMTARIVRAEDGEEHIETVALGWAGSDVYVRMPDTRYRFAAVWLDASDVTRR
ncbi:MAG TPA: hypothetical protein VFI46_05455 [Jiangellaceae bacterium]|nr:hypothetical protein [Jiangellaceae bacterium]